MALSNDNLAGGAANVFREAVCIDTRRIYDACSDKDCVRDLAVSFTDAGQNLINQATNIKVRSAEVCGVHFEVEPLAFNKGFYAVDMTFYFRICVAAYSSSGCQPACLEGIATFSKKVILFGSEASVKTFSTDSALAQTCGGTPIVNVQVVDPMILASKVCPCCPPAPRRFAPPPEISSQFEGSFCEVRAECELFVTLGLFSIVQLMRQVQVMIPIYDFCIPDKECTTQDNCDDPCELFRKVAFPTDEFFPPRLADLEKNDD